MTSQALTLRSPTHGRQPAPASATVCRTISSTRASIARSVVRLSVLSLSSFAILCVCVPYFAENGVVDSASYILPLVRMLNTAVTNTSPPPCPSPLTIIRASCHHSSCTLRCTIQLLLNPEGKYDVDRSRLPKSSIMQVFVICVMRGPALSRLYMLGDAATPLSTLV